MHFQLFRESFSYFMNIVYGRVHLSGILSKLGHFLILKRKFSYDPVTKTSHVSIYFVKSFLKSHSFQEIKASNTISCEANRGDKVILNTFGVAMQTKLISCIVLSTQEKSLSTIFLRYSCPQIELSSEITENSKETIHDAATFLKLTFKVCKYPPTPLPPCN